MRGWADSFRLGLRLGVGTVVALLAACGKSGPSASSVAAAPAKHEHHAPHGGTPVVLGNELYHLELVREAGPGTLSAYVLDGEMENFTRIGQTGITLRATIAGHEQTLLLHAVANPATGETVGDTALFSGQADWLRTTPEFDGRVDSVTVRGHEFRGVGFNFPLGNDRD